MAVFERYGLGMSLTMILILAVLGYLAYDLYTYLYTGASTFMTLWAAIVPQSIDPRGLRS